jgi:tetratricopeptide (TPR) repeat protein
MRGRRWLLQLSIVAMAGVTTVLLALAANVATGGTLPHPLHSYRAWIWPAVGVLGTLTVLLPLWQKALERDFHTEPEPPKIIRKTKIEVGRDKYDVSGDLVLVRQSSDRGLQKNVPPAPVHTIRQLPPDIGDFTGRREELLRLREMLLATKSAPSVVAISAVSGKPGVGKSALAVHIGHQLVDAFPDGQIYVDLRGPQKERLDPAPILDELLMTLGLARRVLPTTLSHKSSVFRQQLAGKRMLVILDNVATEGQVRPLLPGTPDCSVLITSRTQLTIEGVKTLELEVLDADAAVELLATIAGESILDDRAAAESLARLCGHLPLALRIAAYLLRGRTASELARTLSDERERLRKLGKGDLDVRTSFQISYDELESATAQVFRLLGVIPWSDFSCEAVAALADMPVDEATAHLDELYIAQLVERSGSPGWFHFHDLIGLFARDCLNDIPGDDSPSFRESALNRLFEWYLELAKASNKALRSTEFIVAERHERATPTVFQRLEAEKDNLILVIAALFESGRHDLLLDLGAYLAEFLDAWGHGSNWEQAATWALAAARQQGNDRHQAMSLTMLSRAYQKQKRFSDALRCLQEALEISEKFGDVRGKAWAFHNLGLVRSGQGKPDEARSYYQLSLDMFRSIGDRRHEARTLNNLGLLEQDTGSLQEALLYFKDSLTICEEVGDRYNEAFVCYNLALAQHERAMLNEARSYYRRSLVLFRQFGDRNGEALTLNNLGVVELQTDRLDGATAYLMDGLAISEELGDRHGEAISCFNLGRVCQEQGRHYDAMVFSERAAAINDELDERNGEGRPIYTRWNR